MTETTASLLPYLGVLKVSGDDRASFLHNQLSNDINNLPASHACYATYNTPKGRVMANMLVLNTGDELWLIMSADLIDAIAKRLRMFVMRSKAVLENVSDRLGVASSLIPTDEDYDLPIVFGKLPCLTQAYCVWANLPHCLPTMKKPNCNGAAMKSTTATHGYVRPTAKPVSPKCSTNTAWAACTFAKAATLAKKSLPARNTVAKSNVAW